MRLKAAGFSWLARVPSGAADLIVQWLESGLAPNCGAVELLYGSATADPEAFHNACDGRAPTVMLVKTATGALFGGFAAVPWPGEQRKYSADEEGVSFMFILASPQIAHPTRLPLKVRKQALLCDREWGPVFGRSDCAIQGSRGLVKFPRSYAGLPDATTFGVGSDTGFDLVRLEVWLWAPLPSEQEVRRI